MFQRHAHQFVALCLSAVVTVAVLAGVNSFASADHGADAMARAAVVMSPRG